MGRKEYAACFLVAALAGLLFGAMVACPTSVGIAMLAVMVASALAR